MNAKDATQIALFGVVAYLLWKFKGSAEKYADDYIARPIAYVISALALPARQHVNGGAVLPDGGYVSFDAIIDNSGKGVDSSNQFTWKSRRYQLIPPRRSDGNYNAKPI